MFVIDGHTKKEYKGFTRMSQTGMKPGVSLLVVWWEGEGDLYLTSDVEVALPEVRRYYKESFDVDNLKITVMSQVRG